MEWIWGSRKTRVCGDLERVILLWCFDPLWKAEGFQLEAKSLHCGQIFGISEGRCVLVVFQSSVCSFLGRLEMLDMKVTHQQVAEDCFLICSVVPSSERTARWGLLTPVK